MHYNWAIMCPYFGTPRIIGFPFGTGGGFVFLAVPILKHFTVIMITVSADPLTLDLLVQQPGACF